jgi:hypothetical protein
MSRLLFEFPKVGTNCGKIAFEFSSVLDAMFSDFFHDRIFHLSISRSSSGEQISGHVFLDYRADFYSNEWVVHMGEVPSNDHIHSVDSRDRDVKSVFWVFLRNAPTVITAEKL